MEGNWFSKKTNSYAYSLALCSVLLLFLCTGLFWASETIAQNILASGESVIKRNELWRLWTTLFAHSDIGHLLANSLFFGIFAYFLAGHFGFWVFPFSALFFGGVTNFLVLQSMKPSTELLGASGIVYWMGGAWITLYFFVERRGPMWKRILSALGVAVILFVPQTLEPQVSYLSHFIGFCIGIIWAFIYFLVRKKEFYAAENCKTYIDPTQLIASSLVEAGSPDQPEYWKANSPPEAK